MNHSLSDIGLGMLVGYLLARGITNRHRHSALSGGADAMEEMQRQASAGPSTPVEPGGLYPGGAAGAVR